MSATMMKRGRLGLLGLPLLLPLQPSEAVNSVSRGTALETQFERGANDVDVKEREPAGACKPDAPAGGAQGLFPGFPDRVPAAPRTAVSVSPSSFVQLQTQTQGNEQQDAEEKQGKGEDGDKNGDHQQEEEAAEEETTASEAPTSEVARKPSVPDMTASCGAWGGLGTNLLGWFNMLGYMFSGDYYLGNTGMDWMHSEHRAEWQILNEDLRGRMQQLNKDEDMSPLLRMHAHWTNFVSEALLDDFHSVGVSVLRIPVGYWLFNEWNSEEAHPSRNRGWSPRTNDEEPDLWYSVENFAVGGLRVLEDALPHMYKRCMRVILDMSVPAGISVKDGAGWAGYAGGTKKACFHTDCNPFEAEEGDLAVAKIPYGSWLKYMEVITKRAFRWINNVNKHFPGMVVGYEPLNMPLTFNQADPEFGKWNKFVVFEYTPMVRKVAEEEELDSVVELVLHPQNLQQVPLGLQKFFPDGVTYLEGMKDFTQGVVKGWRTGFPTTKYPANVPTSQWQGQRAVWDFGAFLAYSPRFGDDPQNLVNASINGKVGEVWRRGNSIAGEWSVATNTTTHGCDMTDKNGVELTVQQKVETAKQMWQKHVDVFTQNKLRAYFYTNGRFAQDGTENFVECRSEDGEQERYCLQTGSEYWNVGGKNLENHDWCLSLARLVKENAVVAAGGASASKGKSIELPGFVDLFADALMVEPTKALDPKLPRRGTGTWFSGQEQMNTTRKVDRKSLRGSKAAAAASESCC